MRIKWGFVAAVAFIKMADLISLQELCVIYTASIIQMALCVKKKNDVNLNTG